MDALRSLILSHEDWLIDRVVHYAQQHDQTRFTSTLREAWRTSIAGLSLPLVTALDEASANATTSGEPIEAAVAFGMEEARKHRWRGIELPMFLELLKLYRQAYSDLIEEMVPDREERHTLSCLLLRMFDSMELGLVREWTATGESEELAQLRGKTRELVNEKNRLLTVLESIAEPVILIDARNCPTYVNAAGSSALLGETSPGASYYGSQEPDRLTALVNDILPKVKDGDAQANLITLQTPTGERSFSISMQEMLDISHKFAGRVIILNDVTDYLEALVAAEDGNRAKSAFLATVSHEIRTPINSIIGLTEIFEAGGLSDNQKRHLSDIRASARILAELIENILGLSRGEANALRRLDEDFDLHAVIETLRRIFEPDLAQRGLVMTVDIATDVPSRLHGDASKLRHVLMNLLSNAIKFTTRGQVSVRVSLSGSETVQNPTLRFEVVDTGVGLPSGGIDWLFTPFAQYAHPNLYAGLRGTGLGLAICKQMIEFLDGRISAAPNPGGGSVFWFEIPFEAARTSLPRERSAPSLSVLLVEDDAIHAMVVQSMLSDLGHAPVLVQGYVAAVQALHRQHFDLVLTDQRLDGGSGLELSAYLRRDSTSALNRLPVILISAHIPPEAKAALDRGDVQHLIEKPISREDLVRVIRQVMATSSSVDADVDPGPPVLACEALNRLLTDLGVERSDRIISSFLDSAAEQRQKLSRGLSKKDFALITETAHQMISASGYVGLQRLADAARRVHECGSAGDINVARRLVRELNTEINNGIVALTAKWQELCEGYGISE